MNSPFPVASDSCGLMRSGFPVNAELLEYGEFPYYGEAGPNGRTCQILYPQWFKKSANTNAAGPISPMPNPDGNDVILRRIPLFRLRISGWFDTDTPYMFFFPPALCFFSINWS